MKVERFGERFKVERFPTEWDFWTGWADGSWEPESFEILDECLTPDSTFVDVGAWIGPLTLWASRRCARVVALEPDPVARNVLELNVARNCDNVEVLPYALSASFGWGNLASRGHGDAGTFGNSMSGLVEEQTDVDVQTVDPPWLFSHYGIVADLVKIDIEGGEARLVEHADFLRRQPLLLALHGPWLTEEQQQAVSTAFSCDARGFGQVFLP